MNLLSDDYPYWIVIPPGTEWNYPSGLYLLDRASVPSYKDEFWALPYHFYSRDRLFNPEHISFFKIAQYFPERLSDSSSNIILPTLHFQPSLYFDAYKRGFNQLKYWIQRGDIYEINYCMEFFSDGITFHPIEYFMSRYDKLRAPYALMFRNRDILYLCFSPELFLHRTGNRLISKPIKGTLKKNSADEDQDALEAFKTSEKERSENAMAVDVARNDFSRLAVRNSVIVPELFAIKKLKNIYQMYSTVECELPGTTTWFDILEATFPMASMTGAPKVSAMEKISEVEGFNRGMYSGTFGVMKNENDAVFNVVIRTLEYQLITGRIRYCAGSAITWKSEPEKEYHECEIKLKSVIT